MTILVAHTGEGGAAAGASDRGTPARSGRMPVLADEAEQVDLSHDIARLVERTSSPDWHVRARAARELGWRREQALPAVPVLIRLLGDKTLGDSNEISPHIRAMEALGLIGKPAVPALVDALKDGDSDLRDCAASLLGEIGDARAVEPLVAVLDDPDKGVLAAAIMSLADLADRRAVAPLAKFILDKTKDDFCRDLAVQSLGALPSPEAIELLTGILKDDGEEISLRNTAAIALGTTRDRGAAETLLQMTGVPNRSLRCGVFWGLGRTGDARAISVLIRCLKNRDEDKNVRQAAAIGLGRSRAPNAVRYLLGAVEDKSENRRVRESLMAALAFTGDPVAMRRLFKELKGGDLQNAAALALPCISDREAVGPLVDALKNDSPMVRRFAAKALGKLGDRRAAQPLKALLKDGDLSVTANARGALKRIEGPPWSGLDTGGSRGIAYEDEEARAKLLGPLP